MQQRLEQQQRARELMIAQQLAFQQQQQQYQTQYPNVQAFNYASVYSSPPVYSPTANDFPPSYDNAVDTKHTNPDPAPDGRFVNPQ